MTELVANSDTTVNKSDASRHQSACRDASLGMLTRVMCQLIMVLNIASLPR